MKLVIAETSAQAKVLSEALGEGWRVEPCYGFVRDLPPNALGVETEDNFRAAFTVVKGKGGLAIRLKKALREAEVIYAAASPGIDGEAMAWHVLDLEFGGKEKKPPVYRVMLDALTPATIRESFASPLPLDLKRVEAALTVRIADRLASYTVNKALGSESPLTYAAMVALRLLANREAATSRNYWLSSVRFKESHSPFTAKVLNAKGKPLTLRSEAQVEQLKRMLQHAHYWVEKRGGTLRTHPAPDPLTLAALIENAALEFDLPTARTLSIVATLYDAGLISHPDGLMPAASTEAAQAYIQQAFGEAHLSPDEPSVNGIAPVDVSRQPEEVAGDGAALYGLIWRYFVAAHMTPAQERITATRIRVGPSREKPYPITLLAQAREFVFDGWLRVFKDRKPDETGSHLPLLKEGMALGSAQAELVLDQRQMAERFNEMSLTSALMQSGFGAQAAVEAIALLQDSRLVTIDHRAFVLTDSGVQTAATLRETFTRLTDPVYAAQFFARVAAIETGEATRAGILNAFWSQLGDGVKSDSGVNPDPAKKPAVGVEEA